MRDEFTDAGTLGLTLSTPDLFMLSASQVEYFSVWSTIKLRCWSNAFFLFSSNLVCCLYSTSYNKNTFAFNKFNKNVLHLGLTF